MKRRVEITLGLEIDQFSEEIEVVFLRTISVLSGAYVEELRIANVRSGCIKITLEIDAEALKKLIHAIEPMATNLEPLAADQTLALGVLWDQLRFQFLEENAKVGTEKIARQRFSSPDRIFFVHGWRGGSTSFGELPKFIGEITGCDCRIFVYPTGFFEYSSSASFLARAFDNWVRNELEDSEANFGIIAHSMGGVIARDFLGSQLLRSDPLSERVRHVSFVASPQGGAWLSKIANLLPTSAAQQVADLAPNSEYLGRVNSAWNAWYPQQDHLSNQVRSFFAVADEVVDYVSAIGSDPDAIPILDANHSSIIKPKNSSCEIVRTLARLIKSSGLSPASDVELNRQRSNLREL